MTIERSPSRLGPDERNVDAGRRYWERATTSQIGKIRHANEGVRFHVAYSMLTMSGRRTTPGKEIFQNKTSSFHDQLVESSYAAAWYESSCLVAHTPG
jgi:hypothetical protein